MSRLTNDFIVTEQAKQILSNIQKNMGMIPNIFKLIAHAPNVLDGYLYFHNSLSKGELTMQEREYISLRTAAINKCEYCTNAHSAIAKKSGLTLEEIKNALENKSNTPKIQQLLNFVSSIIQNHGNINDQQLTTIKNTGYSETAIVEIIASVALNIFTNYFNNIVQPEIDFPKPG